MVDNNKGQPRGKIDGYWRGDYLGGGGEGGGGREGRGRGYILFPPNTQPSTNNIFTQNLSTISNTLKPPKIF